MSDLETPPIKVVPMFIDEPEPEPVEPPPPPRFAGLRRVPGMLSLALAVATAVLGGIAVAVATGADFDTSTTLGWVAIGTSAGAVLVGVAAIVLRWGRGFGIAGVVLGILANPYLLLQGLTALSTVTF